MKYPILLALMALMLAACEPQARQVSHTSQQSAGGPPARYLPSKTKADGNARAVEGGVQSADTADFGAEVDALVAELEATHLGETSTAVEASAHIGDVHPGASSESKAAPAVSPRPLRELRQELWAILLGTQAGGSAPLDGPLGEQLLDDPVLLEILREAKAAGHLDPEAQPQLFEILERAEHAEGAAAQER